MDLDVDSDNDGVITDADDDIEDDPFSPARPGKWGWTNNDDSNGDTTSDNTNTVIDGAADLEDIGELVVRNLDLSSATNPEVRLEIGNPALIRVFRSKTAEATALAGGPGLPASVDLLAELGHPVGWTLGMEGLMPGTTTLTLRLMDNGVELCSDTVRVTVIGLDVAWEVLVANAPPIDEPNDHPSHAGLPGGALGVKYFPGGTVAGDPWSHFVRVLVSTDPPVEGVSVFLKAFDPDDPSANNDVVDDNLTGTDNRDDNDLDTMELASTQLMTDANGEAPTTFRVAHQPGDNHRVAATIKPTTQLLPTLDMLNDDNVPPSNTQNPPTQDQVELFIGNISPLLTVWRKVHVELDSMGPVAGNSIAGTILGVTDLAPLPRIKFEIPDLPEDFEETDHFNPGQITIQGFAGTFVTVGTDLGDATPNDFVTIRNQAGIDFSGAVGANFTLFDDDIEFLTFPPAVVLPRLPDTTLMNSVYSRAYIGIELLTQPPESQVDLAFDRNIRTQTAAYNLIDTSKNVSSSDAYWVAHVVSAFQPYLPRDDDPDTEEGTHPKGLLYGLTRVSGTFGGTRGGSVIFLETIRDKGGTLAAAAALEQFNVAHEVGHQFQLEHPDGNEDPPGSGTYMMKTAPNDIFPNNLEFSPTSLKKIRDKNHPQDE